MYRAHIEIEHTSWTEFFCVFLSLYLSRVYYVSLSSPLNLRFSFLLGFYTCFHTLLSTASHYPLFVYRAMISRTLSHVSVRPLSVVVSSKSTPRTFRSRTFTARKNMITLSGMRIAWSLADNLPKRLSNAENTSRIFSPLSGVSTQSSNPLHVALEESTIENLDFRASSNVFHIGFCCSI